MSWLKVVTNTPDKPEVWAISGSLGMDRDTVFGKLFRIWRWFDEHTEDGNAYGVTKALVDETAGVTGFADAMVAVHWLVILENGICLPNFDRHNGETAKKRANTAVRVAKHKTNAKGNAHSVTAALEGALPREDKRREEKKTPKEETAVVIPEQPPEEPPAPLPIDQIPRSRGAEISLLMRSNGVEGCNASNPIVQEWAGNPLVTDDMLLTAASMAKERNVARPGPNYLKPIIEQLLDPPKPKPRADDWYRSDAGIARKASELGIYPRPGELYPALRERCESEIRKREKGQAA